MKGDPRVLDLLNEVLTIELTAIIQYVLHARTCDKWGYKHLSKKFRDEAMDEVKDADILKERILYLEGHPNLQRLRKVSTGENVPEMLRLDLELERIAGGTLNRGIDLARQAGDSDTADVLKNILDDEEDHANWLEGQIAAIEMDVQNYLAEQVKQS